MGFKGHSSLALERLWIYWWLHLRVTTNGVFIRYWKMISLVFSSFENETEFVNVQFIGNYIGRWVLFAEHRYIIIHFSELGLQSNKQPNLAIDRSYTRNFAKFVCSDNKRTTSTTTETIHQS